MDELKHIRRHKSLRPSVVADCEKWEALLHDNKLHDWDEYAVDEILYALHFRENLDVEVWLARRWIDRVSQKDIHARRVLEQWETQRISVFDTASEEGVIEILIFRMLTWQRTSNLIVKAWKAAKDGIPVDTVCQRVLIEILAAISWEEKAADGAHAYEW